MEKKYPIGGYAPGNYQCHCGTCGGGFIGDKRAFQCEPCALNDKAKFDALSPSEQEELIKRNAQTMNEMLSKVGTFTTESPAEQPVRGVEAINMMCWAFANIRELDKGSGQVYLYDGQTFPVSMLLNKFKEQKEK